MEGANLALRTLIVINGGAAIAILTFLGGVASKDKIDFTKVGAVADTIRYFAIGVALGLVGMALSYFTNYFVAGVEGAKRRIWEHPYLEETPRSKRMHRLNVVFHVAAFVAALASLILFVVGMFAASDKITHLLVK
jgi:heme/copper-type cytochrome/quinol oxidase subunit 1